MSKVSKLLFSCVLLGSTIGTVQAETQYVTENLNTYLRRGAGDQFKIAGAIQSGEAVTILEQQGKSTPRDFYYHESGCIFLVVPRWLPLRQIELHPRS